LAGRALIMSQWYHAGRARRDAAAGLAAATG
jgi:hypothetical protein